MMQLVHTVATLIAVIIPSANGSGDAWGPLPAIDFLGRLLPPENQESVLLAEQLLILVQGRGFLWGWSSSANYETSIPDLLIDEGAVP